MGDIICGLKRDWTYLAVVIDLNSPRVEGWSMDRRIKLFNNTLGGRIRTYLDGVVQSWLSITAQRRMNAAVIRNPRAVYRPKYTHKLF